MDNHNSLAMDSRDVKEASVEGVQRRTKPKKHFVFCVKVTWSDGTVNLVYRRYREFLHLQTMLFQAFPKVFGKSGSKKSNFTPLPDTLSSRMNVGEAIFKRMELVAYFLKEILGKESKITQSKHITSFLTPTPEDMEPRKLSPKKRARFKKRSKSSFTKSMKGRLQKFGRTRVYGINISSPIVLEHFVVMDDYKKQAKTDINLKKGTVVDVIEKRQCGWWLVDADGEVGWAPALFLEPADEMAEVTPNVQTFDIGQGEVYVTSKRYVAVEDDELTFDIGVNLQILEKNFDGWWKASYLGREGWVPVMHLRKLGEERRNSRMGRRKSRLIGSTTQLRSNIEEDDDIIAETRSFRTVNDLNKEEENRSLPKKKKKAKGHVTIMEPGEIDDESRKTSRNDKKTVNAMVEMSSAFLQLQKKGKGPTPESSPRPSLQRKAVSTVVKPTFDREETAENPMSSKDDLNMVRSQSLDSMLPSNSNGTNAPFRSLPNVQEQNDDEEIAATGDISNKTSVSSEISNHVVMERSDLENENVTDSDSGSCDISHDTVSHAELVEALDGFCKQPVGATTHFKTSSNESTPKTSPPKRRPPRPLDSTDSPNLDSPKRRSTLPNGNKTNSGDDVDAGEKQRRNTFPPSSVDRMVIRQDSIEEETAKDLNQQMKVWSSSDDDSESEWEKSHLNQSKTQNPPSILVDETEKGPTPDGNVCLPLDDGVASTESFEIEINLSNGVQHSGEEYRPEIYRVGKSHAVDSEMFLSEGSHVKVLEQTEAGWSFVQSEEGVRGWTRSSFLVLPRGRRKNDTFSQAEEEDGDDEGDADDEEELSSKHLSCRVLEDYTADPDNQEIDLHEDEIVRILHKTDSGWWCVQNEQGDVGWAPSTFLEDLEDEDIE